MDTSGNVYVTGYSFATWGSPVRPYAGGTDDAFVAKLNASGALQWNTFLGGVNDDYGYRIAADTSGNVYVTGYSYATWGSPVRPYGGAADAYVAKLNTSGVLQWNTFLGGSGYDYGSGIAVDTSGNVYVTGCSDATWGSPVHPYIGNGDAFVAKVKEVVSYNLTIASGPHGTTNPVPGTYSYVSGSTASVSAIADSGYAFDRWTGDVPGGQETSTTVTIPLTADKSIQANFIKLIQPPLSLTGEKLVNRNVSVVEYIARLRWQANSANTGTITYRIYQIANGQAAKVADVGAGKYEYIVRKLQKTTSYQFGVTAVNSLGWESDMAVVTIQ